jgi:hypothetical protein
VAHFLWPRPGVIPSASPLVPTLGVTVQDFPRIDSHAIQSFRRFYKLLPRSDDAALVILKLHLLVEEQVRTYVSERMAQPTALDAAALTFHQMTCIAEAVCIEEIDHRIWDAARKLNELRNKFAHVLEPAGAVQRMEGICELLGVHKSTWHGEAAQDQTPLLEKLGFAISLVYNQISVHVKRQPAEVLKLVQPAK